MKKLKDAHKLVREDVEILGLIILNVVYKFDSPEQCWAKQSDKFATFSLIVPAFLVWRQKRDQSILDTNNRIKKSREINKLTNLLIIY